MMDELSTIFDDKKTRKTRTAIVNKAKQKLSFESTDEGIDLRSNDSDDALNTSIAQRVKRRVPRKSGEKIFDSNYFFDNIITRISKKYADSNDSDKEVVDLENLNSKLINSKDSLEKRRRTEIGFFATNFEEIRQNSIRDSESERSPVIASKASTSGTNKKRLTTTTITMSTPKPKTNTKPIMGANYNKQSVALNSKSAVVKQNIGNSLKAKKSVVKSAQSLVPAVANNEHNLVVDLNSNQESGTQEIDRAMAAIEKYENREYLTSKYFQKECLKQTIETLSKYDSTAFYLRVKLIRLAQKTLGLQLLPSASGNCVPLIAFNSKGEPHFEFYFNSADNPMHSSEKLCHTDHELLELCSIIYNIINDGSKPDESDSLMIQ